MPEVEETTLGWKLLVSSSRSPGIEVHGCVLFAYCTLGTVHCSKDNLFFDAPKPERLGTVLKL